MPTVLVTGANRGIGFAFARRYAALGWEVVAACRKPGEAEALKELARESGKVRIEALDVTEGASIVSLAKRLSGVALDVLINGAGIYSGCAGMDAATADASQTFGSIDAAAWERVLRTNTIAPAMVTQALLPPILRGGAKKIVMISSMMGSIARQTSGAIAYRTSKAALNMAMRNIAEALRARGVTVVSFHPGWVKTDMGGPGADIAADESAAGMVQIIEGLTLQQSGSFIGYDGRTWPW
jgi:NAD(P)-dependent dehydrogenase (short-subunit alcohol dehydrogenase family)